MQGKSLVWYPLLFVIFILGLVGCSRTPNDISRWKAKGKTEKLIRALEDPKPEIRLASINALRDLKADHAIDSFASLFDDPEPDVVVCAIEALAAIGNDPATTHLILALQLDLVDARITAAKNLGLCKTSKAIEELGDALNDSEIDVACAAAAALQLIGEEKSSISLAGGLKSKSIPLRLACVQALGTTGGNAAVKALLDAMADPTPEVSQTAIASLVNIGALSIPLTIEALKSNMIQIRKGAIQTLRKLDAEPIEGNDRIWYQLAHVSIDDTDELRMAVVHEIALRDEPHGGTTLLQAASHKVRDIREHASHALEVIGQPCVSNAIQAVENRATTAGKNWFNKRNAWNTAPSWRINLWGAVAALNPDFTLDAKDVAAMESKGRKAYQIITAENFQTTREYIPLLIDLLGDTTEPPTEQPDFDANGMPVIKRKIDHFRGITNQQEAKDKLIAAGRTAVLPLITASVGTNELIAGHAANILGEIGDKRALQPLITVLEGKIANHELLTNSPYYIALQKYNDPITEPLLLKVRPNPNRAIQVFERAYPNLRVISAESLDASENNKKPISYRLGYIHNNKKCEYKVIFAKDTKENWKPDPLLPKNLPVTVQ